MKRIFKWFFCNLYYLHYVKNAKREDRSSLVGNESDSERVSFVGLLCFVPIEILVVVPLIREYVKEYKPIVYLFCIFITGFGYYVAYRWLYKNKLYIKLLEGFSEKNFNRYILLYALLFLFILPMGLLSLIYLA